MRNTNDALNQKHKQEMLMVLEEKEKIQENIDLLSVENFKLLSDSYKIQRDYEESEKNLNEEILKIKSKNVELSAEIVILESNNKELIGINSCLKSDITNLEDCLSSYTQEVTVLKDQNCKFNEDLKAIHEHYMQINKNHELELIEMRKHLDDQDSELKTQIKEKSDIICGLESRIKSLLSQIDDVKYKMKDVTQYESEIIPNLQQELSSLQKVCDVKDQELQHVVRKNDQYKNTINEYTSTIDEQQATIDTLQKTITDLEISVKNSETKVLTLNNQTKEYLKEITNLQLLSEQKTKEMQQHIKKIANLEHQLKEQASFNTLTQKNDGQLRIEMEKLEIKNIELNKKMNKMELINNELKEQNAELKLKVDERLQQLHESQQMYQFKTGQMETEIEKINKQYREQSKKVLELDKLRKANASSRDFRQVMGENYKLRVSVYFTINYYCRIKNLFDRL